MEAFDEDDEVLGRPTVRVDARAFRKDPRAAVAAVEAQGLGGASLEMPSAAYDAVSGEDRDAPYLAAWRAWPADDHDAVTPGRLARGAIPPAYAEVDAFLEPDGEARARTARKGADGEGSAPAAAAGKGAAAADAEFEPVAWVVAERGARAIFDDFGDACERLGYPLWDHPEL